MLKIMKENAIDLKKLGVADFVLLLLDSTISRRAQMVSEDLKDQVINAVKSSPVVHSITSDESCGVNNKTQSVSFVRQ